MNKSKALWKAQLLHDKVVKAEIKEQLQVFVAAIIDINSLEIVEGDFDVYPSCKNWEKKFCRCKPVKMIGKYKSYLWYGNNEVEIYCEIIKSYCGEHPLTIPFTFLKTKEGKS